MNGKPLWQREQVYWLALAIGLLASLALNPSWLTAALLVLLALASFLRRQVQESEMDSVPAPAALPASAARLAPGVAAGGKEASEPPLIPEQCRIQGDAVIGFIQIDNLEDVLQGLDETQRNTLRSETHQHLLAWCSRMNGFLRKYSDDTYMGIFSRPDLDRMIGEKFDILDEVRALRAGNKIPVTLSIGIAANGATMSERGQKAQTGLDLALGRGGDQAAVYVNEEVQFYGGKAKVMEKSTRVKARVVAETLEEMQHLLTHVIAHIDGVERLFPSLALKVFKYNPEWAPL